MSDYKARIQARVQQASEQMDLRAMQRQAAQNETVELDPTVDADLSRITVDERIQVRVGGLDQDKVREYAVVMSEGGEFPPVVLFRDGETLYLADGFHRVAAAELLGLSEIRAEIRPGGFAGAVEYAEDANLTHGFALSTRDKRNIFERRVQRGHEWTLTSDREIARQLGVDQKTIGNWRRALAREENSSPVSTHRIGADGKVYDVGGIQAANEQRTQQKPSRAPSQRLVTQEDGYDFNQDSGYEEGALDYGEPAGQVNRIHAPRWVELSPARRVSAALENLIEITMEVRLAIETVDAEQDHFTADELYEIQESVTEALQYLQGYRTRQGQRVAGLLDLLDGLRRFVRGDRE